MTNLKAQRRATSGVTGPTDDPGRSEHDVLDHVAVRRTAAAGLPPRGRTVAVATWLYSAGRVITTTRHRPVTLRGPFNLAAIRQR